MTQYSGIFLRNALDDDNSLPRDGGAVTASPDVINAGTAPAANPQSAYGDTYDETVGGHLTYGQHNYIYVRGKNYADATTTGSAALYWCYATQLDTPSTWQGLTTASGANASPLSADSDEVAVTHQPFVWTPSLSSNAQVLIASVSDPNNPDPVPAYMKSSHPQPFADWQADLGGVAALQFTPPPPPPVKGTYSFSGLLVLDNQADESLTFNISVKNGVVGDKIACTFDQSDSGGNALGLATTAITSTDMVVGFQATVPAGFVSQFAFDYAAQDLANPPKPTLTLQVLKVVSSGGGSSGPFNPSGGNSQAVLLAQFVMDTSLPS